jgi:hypothetical protein
MIRSDAKSWPPHRYLRKFHRRLLEVRQLLVRDIEVVDRALAYRFRCETVREFNRCLKLFSKEPGTLAWIRSEVKPGQVFYDIGANSRRVKSRKGAAMRFSARPGEAFAPTRPILSRTE